MNPRRCLTTLFRGALLLPALGCGVAAATVDPAPAMRLLKAECLSCHQDDKRKGGLSLASREALMAGGDEGAAVVEGKPGESRLIQLLEPGADPHMPPKKQLGADGIAVLADWVRQGAPWDAAALAGQVAELRPVSLAPLPASYRPVMALAVSPDGTRLAAGCGQELLLFEAGEAGLVLEARAQAHLDPVQALAWLPDGKSIVTGAFRRAVVWAAASLTQQREVVSGLTDRITVILPSPQPGRVFLADGLVAESGVVRELEIGTGRILRSWPAHGDTVFAMALSQDGTRLATAGGDKLVKLWDPATGQETARLEGHATQVLSLAFHPDGSQLVTGGADRQLKVWDVATRENIIALPGKASACNALQWHRGGPAVFAAMEDGALLKFTDFKSHTGAQSSESGTELRLGAAESPLYALAVDPAGGRIYGGTRQGRILVWNAEGKLLAEVDPAAPAITNATTAAKP